MGAAAVKKQEPADRASELDAELASATREEPGKNVERDIHPFLRAQAYALERRNAKLAYIQATVGARIRRKCKNHQEAERLFEEALKHREAILALEGLVEKESEDVQTYFRDILKDWEADLERELESKATQRKARSAE